MNDPGIPAWFLEVIAICVLAQTALLFFACFLIRDWASKLNRKLHRIESNTRHTVEAITPEEDAVDG